MKAPSPLAGTWVATDMYSQEKSFAELFPSARPVITFDTDKKLVSGMSGCNNYMGNLTLSGQWFTIPGGLAVTKRACAQGMEGEAAFLNTLNKVNQWTLHNPDQLHLLINDMTVLWLKRIKAVQSNQ